MAGKRSATSDLNHDNWDQDEEPEDAGTFQKAPEESLKRRIIKTARRRNPISSVRGTEPAGKSAFTGFTGFSKVAVPATTSFSFLTNTSNQSEKPNSNGTSGNIGNSINEKNISTPAASTNKSPIFTGIDSSIPTKDTKGKSNDYYSKLKGLNESVSNWIKKHVDANPLINLQPIFKDYERYFQELEKEESRRGEAKTDNPKKNISVLSSFVFNTATNVPDSTTEKTGQGLSQSSSNKDISKFSLGYSPGFGNMPSDTIPKFGFSNTSTSNTFSFGTSISTTNSTVTPSFSFGGNVSASNATGFCITSAAPFTFKNVSQPSSTSGSEKPKGSDDEDEPPKVEFTPVVEKDHIYTTRCKLFVKKDDSFSDRGVGNLFLKPIDNSEKVQVILRADTNLGNLLCNFILSESIPTKRMGKKDVMLVCLPTPDFKPPPVPILLRVKSSEDADKLLQVLEKHKK